METDGKPAGEGLNDGAGRAVVTLTRPGCAQLFIIYGSRAGGVPTHFLQKTRLAARNLVLIRDPWDANFTRGVGPEFPDFDDLVAWQREHIEELTHVREVHTFGFSSGGFAALLFGHLLGAKTSWAFSPRSGLRVPGGVPMALSLLRAHLARGSGATEHRIYFAPENELDAKLCARFEGLPGVVMCPRPDLGDTHETMRGLAVSGELARMLPPFLPA